MLPVGVYHLLCGLELKELANLELRAEVQVIDPDTWNMWRTKNMLYLLDKRTIRVVSGASMIFSAPRVQWLQVLERLDISGEGSDDIFIETVVSC